MDKKQIIRRMFENENAPSLSESQMESLEPVVDFWTRTLINQLIERFSSVKNWQIIGIVECEIKVDQDDTLDENVPYALEKKSAIKPPRKHYKQNIDDKNSMFVCEYVWQEAGANEKDYYGTTMLPIGNHQFIKVSFSC